MTQYFGVLLRLIAQQLLSVFELQWISITEQQFPTETPARPKCSYSCLISIALNSCKAQRLHLSQIIGFIERRFPYYSSNTGDWKVEIRNTLSKSGYFRKALTSRGSDGRSRVLYWGFNPTMKAAAEEEVMTWLTAGEAGWATEYENNSTGEHTPQHSSIRAGHKRPRHDMAAQDTTLESTEEDHYLGEAAQLPPKRRWIEANWSPYPTNDEVTNKCSTDRAHGDTDHDRTGIHTICNSPNIEFDGIVHMDINTHTLTLG